MLSEKQMRLLMYRVARSKNSPESMGRYQNELLRNKSGEVMSQDMAPEGDRLMDTVAERDTDRHD